MFAKRFGEVQPFDGMASFEQRSTDECLFVMAGAGLAHQAKIAVAAGVDLIGGHGLDAGQRLLQRSGSRRAAPWVDRLPHVINAAADGLQHRLAWVQAQAQARQECIDAGQRVIEPLGRLV